MRTISDLRIFFAMVLASTATFSATAESGVGANIQDLRFYAGMSAVGAPGVNYEVQYTTNLQDAGGWTTLTNLVLDSNRLFFVDLDSPFSATRFYRLRAVAPSAVSGGVTSVAAEAGPIARRTTDFSKAEPTLAAIGLKKMPIKDGWGEVINPDGDCQVRVKGDSIQMEVPGAAHDFAAELKQWNAPRVLTEIEGDFMLTVDVGGKFQPAAPSTISGRRPYHGAGVLLVQDEQNHLSLQRGSVLLGTKVRHYANFELRRGPKGKVSNFEFDLEDRDVSLRVARRGNRIVAMTSQDGVNWRAFKPIVVDFPQKLKVGVEGISSSKAPLSCSFQGLAIYRE